VTPAAIAVEATPKRNSAAKASKRVSPSTGDSATTLQTTAVNLASDGDTERKPLSKALARPPMRGSATLVRNNSPAPDTSAGSSCSTPFRSKRSATRRTNVGASGGNAPERPTTVSLTALDRKSFAPDINDPMGIASNNSSSTPAIALPGRNSSAMAKPMHKNKQASVCFERNLNNTGPSEALSCNNSARLA